MLGIGGLGHLALQYARKIGFHVVAIGLGQDIACDALELGAHVYCRSSSNLRFGSLKLALNLGGEWLAPADRFRRKAVAYVAAT